MKFLLPVILLIAATVADVSHLQNSYLPPVGHENHHHHPQHTEYAEQTNEAPQIIGANTYTPEHLVEVSNSLVPEATQPETELYNGDAFTNLQTEDVQSSAPAETYHQEVSYQQPAENYEATQYQEVHQPAAQEFVPQTYGPSIVHSYVSEEGPFGLANQAQQYESAASSSGIDTQYGSNGGYVY